MGPENALEQVLQRLIAAGRLRARSACVGRRLDEQSRGAVARRRRGQRGRRLALLQPLPVLASQVVQTGGDIGVVASLLRASRRRVSRPRTNALRSLALALCVGGRTILRLRCTRSSACRTHAASCSFCAHRDGVRGAQGNPKRHGAPFRPCLRHLLVRRSLAAHHHASSGIPGTRKEVGVTLQRVLGGGVLASRVRLPGAGVSTRPECASR